jgi:hypothetical protein
MYNTVSFYIKDMSTCGFCYLQDSWNQSPVGSAMLSLSKAVGMAVKITSLVMRPGCKS